MKKIITLLMCSIMALGIGGCSSTGNEVLSNEDFYQLLKDEGYEFEISPYTESFTIHGEYDINYLFVSGYENSDIVTLTTNDLELMIMNPSDIHTFVSANNECSINLDETEESDTTECSSTDLIDSENAREEANEILKELKTNPSALMEFCKWYYDENKDFVESE